MTRIRTLAPYVEKKCKHLHLTHLDSDKMAKNKVYNDNGDILEYDDYKLYIFNCMNCGQLVVKEWLRSHFKANEQ